MNNLITKHRPKLLRDVVGQDAVVASLKKVLSDNSVHAFLFQGPAGTGKTTLARIIAAKLKCDSRNIIEIDAASNTGIDEMRKTTEGMIFNVMGGGTNRMYIIDEAHRLSAPAWASLLKSVEEPPPHIYWAFCTTESLKIPPAIRTRCAQYSLNPVSTEIICELLLKIIEAEGFKTPEDVANLLAEKAGGSPRQAISSLAQCSHCLTRKEAIKLLKAVEEDGDAGKLIGALMSGASLIKCLAILKAMEGTAPESIRIIISNYFAKVALNATSPQKAERAMAVLQAFGQSYPPYISSLAPVILSLGELYL